MDNKCTITEHINHIVMMAFNIASNGINRKIFLLAKL
jgi:hypothetical protein